MDGAQFAKMLSDKHLFELDRMEYKYSTVSVKEFAELLRQNFAQPLPLTDFSGNKLFYLPNLAQISTNGMIPSMPALQSLRQSTRESWEIWRASAKRLCSKLMIGCTQKSTRMTTIRFFATAFRFSKCAAW